MLVFVGKTMENVRLRNADYKLIRNGKKAVKMASKPTFESFRLINDDMALVKMKKPVHHTRQAGHMWDSAYWTSPSSICTASTMMSYEPSMVTEPAFYSRTPTALSTTSELPTYIQICVWKLMNFTTLLIIRSSTPFTARKMQKLSVFSKMNWTAFRL